MFLSDEVLGNVEVTINTSIVKWCPAIVVPVHRVAKLLNDKIFHHLEVAVVGGIMQAECVPSRPCSWRHTYIQILA